jgi:hypothetical protein
MQVLVFPRIRNAALITIFILSTLSPVMTNVHPRIPKSEGE